MKCNCRPTLTGPCSPDGARPPATLTAGADRQQLAYALADLVEAAKRYASYSVPLTLATFFLDHKTPLSRTIVSASATWASAAS
jgi:hypothetical protein